MKRRDMLKATKKIASAVLGGSEATIKWIAHVDSVVAKPPLSGLCCMVVVGKCLSVSSGSVFFTPPKRKMKEGKGTRQASKQAERLRSCVRGDAQNKSAQRLEPTTSTTSTTIVILMNYMILDFFILYHNTFCNTVY